MSRNKMSYDEIIERFGVILPTDTDIHAVSVEWHNGMIHQCEGAHKNGIPWPARIESKVSLKSKGGKVTGIVLRADERELFRSEKRIIKNPLYGRLYREGWRNAPPSLSVDGMFHQYLDWKHGVEDWRFQEPTITLSDPISSITPAYADGRLVRVDTTETVDILADGKPVCTLRRLAHIEKAPAEIHIEEPRTGVSLEFPPIHKGMKFNYRAAYRRFRSGRQNTRAKAKRLALAEREQFLASDEYQRLAGIYQMETEKVIEEWRQKKKEVAGKAWIEYTAAKKKAGLEYQAQYAIWRQRIKEKTMLKAKFKKSWGISANGKEVVKCQS